jgi:hypothetical protein
MIGVRGFTSWFCFNSSSERSSLHESTYSYKSCQITGLYTYALLVAG